MRLRPPVVIDTDPGIDDVVTLALAARSPEIQILAVTTSYGNSTLGLTTRNAAAILQLCGRPDIPILPGADRPRSRRLSTAPEAHGESGVGYAPVKPASPAVSANPGVLCEVLDEAARPVTLVTLGPLTNLAAVLERDEELARRRIARHIGMFGSLSERGNLGRWADFNAWSDPEAASMVVRSKLPTEMVGLDVTRQMVISSDEVDHLARSTDEVVRWLAQAMRFSVEYYRRWKRLDGCVINDVLTLGELLTPGILSFETLSIEVDLDEGEHLGQTRRTEGDVSSRLPVATAVDIGGMREVLSRVFGHSWLDSSIGRYS